MRYESCGLCITIDNVMRFDRMRVYEWIRVKGEIGVHCDKYRSFRTSRLLFRPPPVGLSDGQCECFEFAGEFA